MTQERAEQKQGIAVLPDAGLELGLASEGMQKLSSHTLEDKEAFKIGK